MAQQDQAAQVDSPEAMDRRRRVVIQASLAIPGLPDHLDERVRQ